MCNGGSRKRSQIRRFAMVRNRKKPGSFLNNSAGSGRHDRSRRCYISRAAPPDPFGGSTAATPACGPRSRPVPHARSAAFSRPAAHFYPAQFSPCILIHPYLTCKHFRSVCKFPSCRVFPVRRIDCAVTIHLTAAYRGIFKSYPRFRTGLYSRSSGN